MVDWQVLVVKLLEHMANTCGQGACIVYLNTVNRCDGRNRSRTRPLAVLRGTGPNERLSMLLSGFSPSTKYWLCARKMGP